MIDLIQENDFLSLAEIHYPHCVSIYIPAEKAAGGEGYKKNNLHLKNALKEVEKKLQAMEMQQRDIDSYLKPFYDLLNDDDFMNYQEGGLALFRHNDSFTYFKLPTKVNAKTYVSDHYYLLPLIPIFSAQSQFYILALSMNQVRFFVANRYQIKSVPVGEYIPTSMLEAVGGDYEQSSLQFRTQQGELGRGMYHGHGEGSDAEKQKELEKYIRQIDDGLSELLENKHHPLILACVDYIYARYKEINKYPHLHEEHIPGNPDHKHPHELQREAWELMEPQYEEEIQEAWKEYENSLPEAKASFNEDKIIKASFMGRTETLFIRKGTELWGMYDPEEHTVKIMSTETATNTDLVNKAAVETIKKGGDVFYLGEKLLQDTAPAMAATFRYAM